MLLCSRLVDLVAYIHAFALDFSLQSSSCVSHVRIPDRQDTAMMKQAVFGYLIMFPSLLSFLMTCEHQELKDSIDTQEPHQPG